MNWSYSTVWPGRSNRASAGCMHGDRVGLINNNWINKFLSRERIRETTRRCKKILFNSEMLFTSKILAYRWSHSGHEQARHEVGAPYPGTNRFRNVAGLRQQHVKRTQQHYRVGRPLARWSRAFEVQHRLCLYCCRTYPPPEPSSAPHTCIFNSHNVLID